MVEVDSIKYCCKDFQTVAEEYFIQKEEKGFTTGLREDVFGKEIADKTREYVNAGWYIMDREGVPTRVASPLKYCPWCAKELKWRL